MNHVLMKDELCGKTMKEFLELRAKTYSYLLDDSSEDKKSKGTKKRKKYNLNLKIIKPV